VLAIGVESVVVPRVALDVQAAKPKMATPTAPVPTLLRKCLRSMLCVMGGTLAARIGADNEVGVSPSWELRENSAIQAGVQPSGVSVVHIHRDGSGHDNNRDH
jgi:hypothetical protein